MFQLNRLRRDRGVPPGAPAAGGRLEHTDAYYYPPRRDPWPIIAAVVIAVSAVAGIFFWRSDDSRGPNSTEKAPLTASKGMSVNDLHACLSFQRASVDSANILASLAGNGDNVAAGSSFTEEVINGYRSAVELVKPQVKDPALLASLTDLDAQLSAQRTAAIADDAAGSPSWSQRFPAVRQIVDTFATKFEARCNDGGLMVDVNGA